MNLKEINSKEVIPGLHGKFIHGNTISLAVWDVKKGALVPNHNHFHEQIMHVIEGRFEFTLNGNTSIYGPGSVVHISSNLFHSGRALTDCKLMDVFSPIREEYR